MEVKLLLSAGSSHPRALIAARQAGLLHELRVASAITADGASLVEGPLTQVSAASPLIGGGFPGDSNNDPDTAVEPDLAVDPTNPAHLVGVWEQDAYGNGGARGIVSAVSFNSGQTWKESVVTGLTLRSLGPYQRAADPTIVFGVDGQVDLASVVFNTIDGKSADEVSISSNGGRSWHFPATVTSSASALNLIRNGSITADPTTPGLAYSTWNNLVVPSKSAAFQGVAEISKTVDGGRTWSAAKTIVNPGPNAAAVHNTILDEPDGTLVDAFTSLTTTAQGSVNTLDTLTSQDQGQTFPGVPVQGPSLEGAPVTDPDNGAPIQTASTPSNLPTQFAQVIVDPTSGDLYAVWQDARFQLDQYDDIVFSASTNGGLTWSTPIPINQTPSNIPYPNRQAFDPSIAILANGSIGVSYYDFRNNDTSLGARADAFLVVAPAGSNPTEPASWANEIRLTTNSFDIETAPNTQNGYFLGNSEGLVASGNTFIALFSATNGNDKTDAFARTVTVTT